jgi:hypothetical protein
MYLCEIRATSLVLEPIGKPAFVLLLSLAMTIDTRKNLCYKDVDEEIEAQAVPRAQPCCKMLSFKQPVE